MNIGILALQGDYQAHAAALARACPSINSVEVRQASQLDGLHGLIIPGGESTTMLKLMDYYALFDPLRQFCLARPVLGTCAGAILMATEVLNPPQASFAVMDITVERNAYGRQLDSRVVRIAGHKLEGGDLEAVFIRAPIIRRTGPGVRVLAEYSGDPVLVESGLHLAATFHPELTPDPRVHRLFVDKIEAGLK